MQTTRRSVGQSQIALEIGTISRAQTEICETNFRGFQSRVISISTNLCQLITHTTKMSKSDGGKIIMAKDLKIHISQFN